MNDTMTDTTSYDSSAISHSHAPDPSAAARPERSEWPAGYTIYKPNTRGSGAAIRFSLNPAKAAVFLEAARQSGERKFDWENKITMKWGLSDLGAALAVLQGRIPKAKLFHQTDRANSAVELVTSDDPERPPFAMSISRQEAEDKSLRKVSLPLTHVEASVLETVLQTAITRLIGW